MPPPHPPTYTRAQLAQYLHRIGYHHHHHHHHHHNNEASDDNDDGEARLLHLEQSVQHDPLSALTALQRHHLAAIPFGNTVLHYSPHRTVTLHPATLFRKLVERKLDGYCMENTGLFCVVLRSLGFKVYATGGRVSQAASKGARGAVVGEEDEDMGLYGGFNHMVLIVTIGEDKYMVDVGFGPLCPTRPLLLAENRITPSIAPAEMRLVRDSIPEFTDPSQKVWIYQTRFSPKSGWIPGYCFSEIEFLPQDFDVMNLSTSTSRASFFTYRVLCVRMILDEEKEEDIVGQYVLSGNNVKRRIKGKSEILETLETEADRINALAKWFGIHLRPDEVQAIRGMVSEITKP